MVDTHIGGASSALHVVSDEQFVISHGCKNDPMASCEIRNCRLLKRASETLVSELAIRALGQVVTPFSNVCDEGLKLRKPKETIRQLSVKDLVSKLGGFIEPLQETAMLEAHEILDWACEWRSKSTVRNSSASVREPMGRI